MRHFFISDNGDLYDTRVEDWSNKPPLRNGFRYSYKRIENCGSLKATLRNGENAWPGGYPMAIALDTGECAHFDCVKDNLREHFQALKSGREMLCFINYEDRDLHCDNCNEKIESAY